MVYEFAVNPAAIKTWQNFRYIIDQFGVEHGRLITRFPRKWQKLVIRECEEKGAKRTAIVEKLRSIDHKLASIGREYNPEKEWIDNALQQHSIKAFRAIISDINKNDHPDILAADDFDEQNLKWKVPTEDIVPKTPDALVECARFLLFVSKKVHFIDPYFDPFMPEFRSTFEKFLEFVFQGNPPETLKLHTRNKGQKGWKDVFERYFSHKIPKGFSFAVVRWEENEGGNRMHARYVLTELGGIRYDYGLDKGCNESINSDVSLVGYTLAQKRLKDYQQKSTAFNFVDEITVEGY